MATKTVWRCIICSTEAAEQPPRHCPNCGTPAARWRMVVNRAPQLPEEAPPAVEAEQLEGATVDAGEAPTA
ncbi:MAG: hypothetical protein RMA76_20630 [Deltaproteobacteria bacterium]